MEGLVHTAQNSSDDQGILNNVSASAEEAQKALDELIRFIKQTPLSTQQDGKAQEYCKIVIGGWLSVFFKKLF